MIYYYDYEVLSKGGKNETLPPIVAFNYHLSRVGFQYQGVANRCWRVQQIKGVDEGDFGNLRGKKLPLLQIPMRRRTPSEGHTPSLCCHSPVTPTGSAGCGGRRLRRRSPLRSDHSVGSTDRFLGTKRGKVQLKSGPHYLRPFSFPHAVNNTHSEERFSHRTNTKVS